MKVQASNCNNGIYVTKRKKYATYIPITSRLFWYESYKVLVVIANKKKKKNHLCGGETKQKPK